jgi:hypothetical protein
MKELIALSLLVASACAGPSAALGRRTSAESIVGQWRGVLVKGDMRTPADFQFAATEGGYRGSYWGRGLTPIALGNVELGHSIHFEIPQFAAFEGTIRDETIEGTFSDGSGGGSFRLEKQPDLDDPRYAPAG